MLGGGTARRNTGPKYISAAAGDGGAPARNICPMPQTKPLPHLPKLIVDDSLTWEEIEELIVRLDHENRELQARSEEMRQQATHDPLTGLRSEEHTSELQPHSF